MKNIKLGQEVLVIAKLMQVEVTPKSVDQAEKRILETGTPETSRKFFIADLVKPRSGVVVGIRNVVRERIHYLKDSKVVTKTTRQQVLVVACDLRGQYLVPIEKAVVKEGWRPTIEVVYQEFKPETYKGIYIKDGNQKLMTIDIGSFEEDIELMEQTMQSLGVSEYRMGNSVGKYVTELLTSQ